MTENLRNPDISNRAPDAVVREYIEQEPPPEVLPSNVTLCDCFVKNAAETYKIMIILIIYPKKAIKIL